jgi:hypothetical protein
MQIFQSNKRTKKVICIFQEFPLPKRLCHQKHVCRSYSLHISYRFIPLFIYLFKCSLFNDVAHNSRLHMASNGWITVYNDLERVRNEVVVAQYMALSRNLS